MNDFITRRGFRGAAAVCLAFAFALTFVGCSESSSDNSGAPGPAAPLVLTGTAATGAAIAGAPIAVKCKTGAGSGTTLSDGTFSISLAGGVLPCAVEITTTGGATLHSLAAGSGNTAILDITPMTELVVASLAGADPAAFYVGYSATSAALVTQASIAGAESTVVAVLKSAGIDFSPLGDLLSVALKARTPSAAGDPYDQALDAFAAALASGGTTLGAFTTAVINYTRPTPPTTDLASLPPALLLQPAAATCSALRSGTYRLLTPLAGTTLGAQFGLSTIDAGTLRIVRPDGSTGTLVPNGPCRFTDSGTSYGADIVVSQAGVLLGRYTSNAGMSYYNLFGFPEQVHAVSELAGSWNLIGMNTSGSTHVGVSGTATLSAAGQMSGVTHCENDSTWAVDTCVSVPDSTTGLLGPLVVDSAGGFDLPVAASGQVDSRVFVYRSGTGSLVIAAVSNVGFALWARPVTVPLPAVGYSTTSWNLDLNPDFSSNSPNYETTNVVDAVDSTTGSWTRTHGTVGQPLTRVETVFANKPRSGLIFRPAATVTGSDGVTPSVIREFTMLSLTGMGASVGVLPALKVFEFAAREP